MTDVLLENSEEEDHTRLIGHHLEDAKRFICIVAFAMWSGLKLIHKSLVARVAMGMNATFFIGIDFFQSEPEVRRSLLRLRCTATKAGGVIEVYMGSEASLYTLHPKVYWFKGGKEEALIVGSANMTSGGFGQGSRIDTRRVGLVRWGKGDVSGSSACFLRLLSEPICSCRKPARQFRSIVEQV